jgi:hypothetical protein
MLGGAPEYLGRVLSAVDEQAWLEEVVETSLFEQPAHVFFGFLAYVGYDPESDATVAQLFEHSRHLRVNVQPLESVGLSRREADRPERVPDVEESRG